MVVYARIPRVESRPRITCRDSVAITMISQSDKKRFRAIAHHLKPVVTIAGKGLSANVITEINRALNDHELIKVKVNVGDRDERDNLISSLCKETGAQLVQAIGNVAVLYKQAAQPDPALSNVLRGIIL